MKGVELGQPIWVDFKSRSVLANRCSFNLNWITKSNLDILTYTSKQYFRINIFAIAYYENYFNYPP